MIKTVKKLVITLVIITFAILIGCPVQGVVDNKSNTTSEIVECKGLRDKECLEIVDKIEELLPIEIQDKIVDTTDRIEVFVGTDTEFLNYMENEDIHRENERYVGITGYGYEEKTLVYSMANEYVLLHELAHAYDYSFWYEEKMNPSSSTEWNYAYKNEYISVHGTSSVSEFYAECFAMYFRHPSGLRIFAPRAYHLLDEEFSDLKDGTRI